MVASAGVRLALALLISLVTFLPARAMSMLCQVQRIEDGDTLVVMTRDRTPYTIDLHGVDAPELDQPMGMVARRFTEKKIYGQWINVTIVATRENGGLSAVVYDVMRPQMTLNSSVVRNGYGEWERQDAPYSDILRRMQQEASIARRGIWNRLAAIDAAPRHHGGKRWTRTARYPSRYLRSARVRRQNRSVRTGTLHARPERRPQPAEAAAPVMTSVRNETRALLQRTRRQAAGLRRIADRISVLPATQNAALRLARLSG